MSTKSYKKDYTTKEAALMLGVHRDTLMYWEDNDLIPKSRRNPKNNYRAYNTEEILEIAKIRGISVVDIEAVDREKHKRRLKRSAAARAGTLAPA